MRVLAVALIALCVSSTLCQVPWKYCPGADGSKVNVQTCPIQPYPIVKGSPVKFAVQGTAQVAISQKNARMDVYTSGSKIFSTTVGSSYSTAAGSPYNYSFTYSIPSFVPPGSYDVWISMLDNSGNTITCVLVGMNF